MQEQEENIQFDTMPDFRGMFSKQVNPDSTFDEKEYISLFDELVEKCHPNRFIDGNNFNEDLFEKANKLYAEILRCKDSPDEDLISLRNRAIELLGVRISTKKKYDYLDSFLNPKVYTDVAAEEYDAERVSEAAKWYTILQKTRHDIRALEDLEMEASAFINRRKNELSESEIAEREAEIKRKERERLEKEAESLEKEGLIVGILSLLVLLVLVVLIIAAFDN